MPFSEIILFYVWTISLVFPHLLHEAARNIHYTINIETEIIKPHRSTYYYIQAYNAFLSKDFISAGV